MFFNYFNCIFKFFCFFVLMPGFAFSQTSDLDFGFDFMGFIPFIFIFFIMYFMLIRPQQKKANEHRKMISQIVRGDIVLTNGGLIGEVYQIVDENEIRLEIANGIRVRILKSMIAQLMVKNKDEAKK